MSLSLGSLNSTLSNKLTVKTLTVSKSNNLLGSVNVNGAFNPLTGSNGSMSMSPSKAIKDLAGGCISGMSLNGKNSNSIRNGSRKKLDCTKKIAKGVMSGVIDMVPALNKLFSSLPAGTKSDLLDSAVNKVSSLKAPASLRSSLLPKGSCNGGDSLGSLFSAIGGAVSDLMGAGGNMLNGIKNGITSVVNSIMSGVGGVVNGIVGAISGLIGAATSCAESSTSSTKKALITASKDGSNPLDSVSSKSNISSLLDSGKLDIGAVNSFDADSGLPSSETSPVHSMVSEAITDKGVSKLDVNPVLELNNPDKGECTIGGVMSYGDTEGLLDNDAVTTMASKSSVANTKMDTTGTKDSSSSLLSFSQKVVAMKSSVSNNPILPPIKRTPIKNSTPPPPEPANIEINVKVDDEWYSWMVTRTEYKRANEIGNNKSIDSNMRKYKEKIYLDRVAGNRKVVA